MPVPLAAVGKLVFVELKLFVREPVALFFSLIYPVILVVVNGTTKGVRLPGSDVSLINASAPILVTFVISLLGLCTLPPFLAQYREKGILRRLATTPMPPAMMLVAQFAVHAIIAAFGLTLVLTFGTVAFDMRPPASAGAFLVATVVGGLSIFAVGFIVAALSPDSRSATMAGLGLFFPMAVLSGAMVPRQVLSEPLRTIGDFTPMGPFVKEVQAAYDGQALALAPMLVIVGVTLIVGGLAVRVFRW